MIPPTLSRETILTQVNELETKGLHKEANALRSTYKDILAPEVPEATASWLAQFVTVNKSMLDLKAKAIVLSKVQDPVLITGETGTGKELIAHALHGSRPIDRFVDINCAAMPADLMESELFGHIRGAFTGATIDKVGLCEFAKGGTLFLDEIGELDVRVQAKLLRVLQEGVIRRVGDNKNIKIDCRIVAATHRDLYQYVRENKFRSDLLHRLNTFQLDIASLMLRGEDLVPIVTYINEIFTKRCVDKKEPLKYPINDVSAFVDNLKSQYGVAKLTGNVRSLQKIVRNYHLFGKGWN